MDSETANIRATRAAHSIWLQRAVRVGLVAYSVVHVVVAIIAFQIGFGDTSHSANQQGAFHALAAEPFGRGLLWAVSVGLFLLALWQAMEAGWGHRRDDGIKRVLTRLGSACSMVIYGFIGVNAAKVAIGAGARAHSKEWTARLMSLPFGPALVAIVGVIILVVAVMMCVRGIRGDFSSNLDASGRGRVPVETVIRVGQVGYVAKGVAFGIVAGLFFWAAATYDAAKAGGLDVAVTTLAKAPAGPWLLAAMAVGVLCFAAYCLGWALYVDTTDD